MITNQDPLQVLVINDVFTAGDFPVTVKEVDLSSSLRDGIYNGWGYIVVPYLQDTRIKVVFNGIKINSDYQLIEGIVVTDYDQNWGGVVDIGNELQNLEQLISDIKDTIDRLLQNGNITQEEAEQYREEVVEAEEAQIAYNRAEETLSQVEDSDDTEAIEQARTHLEQTQEEKEKQQEELQDLSERLRSIENANNVTQNGNVQPDVYFDGVIPFSTPDQSIQDPRLDGRTLFGNIDVEPDKNADGTFFVSEERSLGNGKRYIVSRSNMGTEIENNEDYKRFKKQIEELNQDQFLLWIHYDFKENKAKYKVAFEDSYYYNQVAQNELVQLYNSVLNFDFRGAIGSAIIGTAEYFDTLLLEFRDYAPFMNEEFLNSGYSTHELLQMVVAFIKKCGEGYTTQNNGLVPRCLWEQDINPAVAYYAGFIDGAFEIAELGWSATKFFKAWNLTDPYFYDPNAAKIRQQTIDLVLMVQKLDEQDVLLSTVWSEVAKSFGEYIDETAALTPQARYNQGKLIFEVVSFFFGVGEAKAFLTTGKITSKTLMALKNIPQRLKTFLSKSVLDFDKVNKKFGVILDATKLGTDEATLKAAKWIKPETGWFDVVVHGTPDNFMVYTGKQWTSISHRDLLNYLRSIGYKKKTPIRLVSCNTGVFPDAIGKNLANKIGSEVKAPKGLITVYEDGSYIISNSGNWRIFKPGL